jgi:hypothetical protein
MTKSVMFFHEALQSYMLAVQQITPVFAYMVSIVYVYEKWLWPAPLMCRLEQCLLFNDEDLCYVITLSCL